jgi:hypothetical protein
MRQVPHGSQEPLAKDVHPVEIQRLDGVVFGVVIGVPEKGRVGDHHGGIAPLPEGTVIGKVDAG